MSVNKIYRLPDGKGPYVLKEEPIPKPGHGQVLVRMHAASINFRDTMIVDGTYPFPGLLKNAIPTSDGAGEVAELGEGVQDLKKGDRVTPLFFEEDNMGLALGGTVDGALAQYRVFSHRSLVKFPDHLSYEEASTLPCAGVTAFNSLFEGKALKVGQTVLLQGTGGVSIFGLQLAKAAGAKVIITSSSDEKIAVAKKLGADQGINYSKNSDWEKVVTELTGGAGADHIIDLGGADTLRRSLDALALNGSISVVGALTGNTKGEFDLFGPVLRTLATIRGIYVGDRNTMESLNRVLAYHKIKPIVDKVFPFGEANKAVEYFREQKHIGKVVIKID